MGKGEQMRWQRRILDWRKKPAPAPPPPGATPSPAPPPSAPDPSTFPELPWKPQPAPAEVEATIRVLNILDSYPPSYDPAADYRGIAANLEAATDGKVSLRWENVYRDMADIAWKPHETLATWWWWADAWIEKVATSYRDVKADCLAIFVHPSRRPGLGASGFDLGMRQGKAVQGHVLSLLLDPDGAWRDKYGPAAVEHELKHAMDDLARQRLGVDLSAIFGASWDWEIIHSQRILDVWPMLHAQGLLMQMFRETGATAAQY